MRFNNASFIIIIIIISPFRLLFVFVTAYTSVYMPQHYADTCNSSIYPAYLSVVIVTLPKDQRRRFMLNAHKFGMTTGQYVFYTIEMLPEETLNGDPVWGGGDGQNVDAKQAFEAVFHVSITWFIGLSE